MTGAPKTVLVWGIVSTLVACVLMYAVPAIAGWAWSGNPYEGQTVLIAIDYGVRFLREIAAPIGAALIAASLVMGFIQGRGQQRS